MAVPRLRMTVYEVRAEKPPRRQLELFCHVANPGPSAICILDAWLKVTAFQDLRIAEGRLFYPEDNRIDPASIRAGANGHGVIVIDLPTLMLERIERRRGGTNDLVLGMSSRVRVSEVSSQTREQLLGVPFETCFTDGRGDFFEYKIAQSDWVGLLRNLEWSELEVVEIPTGKLKAIPALARAFGCFADAQDCYRRGLWDEAMMNCRKAFEAMVKDAVGEDSMKEALRAYEAIMGGGEKAERFNDLTRALGNFLALARHEKLPPIRIRPSDATLAVRMTGAIFSYLGGE